MVYFEVQIAKRTLGVPTDMSVHCCDMCHKIWECNCMMCDGEKHMMCVACWNEYCSKGVVIEDVSQPPRFVKNECY